MQKHAYLVICHKNKDQVIDLIQELVKHIENHCLVFCDMNFNIDLTEILSIGASSQITLIHSNFKIEWGKFSLVEACLLLLEKAYHLNIDFSYFHLISGQDYPIKSNTQIQEFFKNNDKIYIDYFPIPRNDGHWPPDGGLSRYLTSNNKEHLPKNIKILYGGSQWWSLTKESVGYVLNYLKNNPSIMKFYHDTFIPDESFIQTILLNCVELKSKIVNNNIRYIDWKTGPSFPKILIEEDLKKIIQSDCLFARKFDRIEDSEIIKIIKILIR
ncbi:beta-1,6-N-acetylglucosaminyltransferase [Sphingobacterium sp.]|uniref:beta-1,6-N-acetylglucosaminyltransferase n=1 Tax=Sphingobacterium sp. TaxID=341027 RepID=UPI00289E3F95|nr:beta-1,6-N-acetylglucosaminyltransferase [Sphingobacterium sp.]